MSRRLTLVFMIDALGFEQAKDHSFLPKLGTSRAPVESVLGYSSSCIPTIMTGVAPVDHGHFSMYKRADSKGGAFALPGRVLPWITKLTGRHWQIRRLVSRYVRSRGITGYFSLYDIPLEWLHHFDLCQKKNLYQPNAFESMPGLADLIAGLDKSRIWDWSVPEEQAFAELETEIDHAESNCLFFYTSDLDGLMHAVGPGDDQTAKKLSDYDGRIARLIEKAEAKYDEVEVFIFGDHGMAAVKTTRDLWSELEKLPLRVPEDYLYFLDSTMARFWFESEEARTTVTRLLSNVGYGRILDPSDLASLGSKFPEDEYGELVFLLDEGEILVPSFMGRTAIRGMHGYHPKASASYTTLLTNRTDVEYPKNLFDLHHLLRASLQRTSG